MFSPAIDILEFPRVLEIIAGFATSEPGAERVKKLRPKVDIELLHLELKRVEEMVLLMEKGEPPPFKGIYNLEAPLAVASVQGAMLNSEILMRFAITLGSARMVRKFLLDRAHLVSRLADMANAMQTFEELEKAVHHAIDETYEIRDSASPALHHIRSAIAVERQRARATLARLLKEWSSRGFLQEEVIASREGRLTLPVKDNAKGRIKGLLVDQSASGSTVFIEPLETVEINNEIRKLELEERREIERILREITAIVYKYRFEIADTLNLLIELDSVFARAEYAGKFNCMKPVVMSDNRLNVVRGRHPLLLIKEKEVVPLDLDIGEGIYSLVISGPNAGGKTVALKTVGILTLMAISGCFVPAGKGTILPVPLEIHAVIGDDQSIAADLSTFSAHLAKLARVTQTEISRKLVLIDEIMSGTDPAEGTALAIALLEKLTNDRALTLCTTHKGDLKAFAHSAPGVANGSLEFDPKTLSPTYRFLYGIPGSSYAFAVAKKVGLPDYLIAKAETIRGEDRQAMENLLIELQTKLREIEKERASANLATAEVESLQRQLEDRLQNAKSIEAKIKERAEIDAEKILAEANRALEQAIREIKEKSASAEAIKTAHDTIAIAKETFKHRRPKKEPPPRPKGEPGPIRIGDRVLCEGSDVRGMVTSGKDSKGRFLVEAGTIKIWVKEDQLIKLSPLKPSEAKPKVKVHYQISNANINNKIDLRGSISSEATTRLEEYLVQAMNANFSRVEILHGKGDGILRKVVQDILHKKPGVKSFRDGEQSEGDWGVTIVELDT
jgi:DNA mismatch repair protein MutS2